MTSRQRATVCGRSLTGSPLFDGTRLRKRRRERDISQKRLSYRSRVSLSTIQRIEKLTAASCHVRTLQRLANVLSTHPDNLIAELTESFSGWPEAARRRGITLAEAAPRGQPHRG
jgi:transcriptional regulator with XRE-family HTH domain